MLLTWANAGETSGRIDACSSIVTWILMQTLIDVNGAMFSSEAATLADWSRAPLLADAIVLARVGVAILAIVTSLPTQLGWTLTVVIILEVDTLGTMQTRAGGAGVQVILARGAGETWRTRAHKVAACGQLQTRATILTRLLLAT